MSVSRLGALQRFLDAAQAAMIGAAGGGHPAHPVLAESFGALCEAGPRAREAVGARLPVCAHFEAAIRKAEQGPPAAAALAGALAALEPHLSWSRRPGAEAVGGAFVENHANARIDGDGGLESRHDVVIGVSLMAAHIDYPEHNHPPEEVYIALSPGEWRQGTGAWYSPGIGGLVHNPPNLRHAMRSTDAPLLAIWCLRPR